MTRTIKYATAIVGIVSLLGMAAPALATLTVGATSVTSTGVLTLQGAANSWFKTTAGNLDLDAYAALYVGTSTATSIVIGQSGVTTMVQGPLTASSTITLQNSATIGNATANQINLAGAGEAVGTRVGLLRAGYNGYGSELGGSSTLNPVTVSGTGNRAGAELYYGYSGATGDMRGLRVFIDNEKTGGGTSGTLSGADIEARGYSGSSAGGTVALARGILAGVLSKNDTLTNAVGVRADLDTGHGDYGVGSVGTWKALYVTHSDNQGAVTQGYGLYIDSTNKQGTSGGSTDGNIATMTDIYLQNAATIDNAVSGTLNLTATTIKVTGDMTVTGTATMASTTVNGLFKIPNFAADPATCDASAKGAVYFKTVKNNFMVCDGVQWAKVSTSTPN